MDEYAMYKGDHFIDLGTLSYLAHKYHKRAMVTDYCFTKLKMIKGEKNE